MQGIMDTNTRPCLSCISFSIVICSILVFASSIHPSNAADTLSLGQSLSGNQTLVSEGGNFELGFFSPPGNSHNYYIGIWFKTIPTKDVIWIANRQIPISNPSTSMLKLSLDGNLVLLNNQSKIPVWSSNSIPSTSNSTMAVLLDTGNLVVRSTANSTSPIWQSYDHPSHVVLPGGWLGVNKLTGEIQKVTSWRSPDDPSLGFYSLSIDPDRFDQFGLGYNGSSFYWATGHWNGHYFNDNPELHTVSLLRNDKEGKYFTFTSPVMGYSLMDITGQYKLFLWSSSTQKWTLVYVEPLQLCDVPSICGAFGLCNRRSSLLCSCYEGFEPVSKKEWDSGFWSSGCVRRTGFQCHANNSAHGRQDGFFLKQMSQLPSSPQNFTLQNAEECEMTCKSNCFCIAYAYDNTLCSIWSGDLRNGEPSYDDNTKVSTLYLRLAASDIPPPIPSPPRHNTSTAPTISGVTAGLLFICVIVGLIWARKHTRIWFVKQVDYSLTTFTYAELQRMTKNFSEKLGKGGFGSVFKGTLPDSTVIAVKKLEGLGQGEKQFRTEVNTLGTIQHVNLVRLRGFCSQGSKRLLVYDYISQGSLESYLFGNSKLLNWQTRYQIILGTARGIAYLHEKCRDCIIHCDIKPDNILIDKDFSPKVADFGMAKLIGRDFSRVLTTIRGTRGYLAPEWILGLPITPKVDIYSFGMMLFEIVSGKRNLNSNEDGSNCCFFPFKVARQLAEDNLVNYLLDERLEGEANMEEVNRVCRVACWCIQDMDCHRPTMEQVVQILEGVLDVGMPGIPRSLQYLMEDIEVEGKTSSFHSMSFAEDITSVQGNL